MERGRWWVGSSGKKGCRWQEVQEGVCSEPDLSFEDGYVGVNWVLQYCVDSFSCKLQLAVQSDRFDAV